MVGYKYSYDEVSSAAEDLNQEAGDGSHYHSLPTQCFDKNLNKGLTDYFENIKHIIDYGEFRHPEYEPMLRRGRKENVIRSYDKYIQISSDNTAKVTATSNVFSAILSKIKNDTIVIEEQELLISAFLLDQQIDDSAVARIQNVPVSFYFENNSYLIIYNKKTGFLL